MAVFRFVTDNRKDSLVDRFGSDALAARRRRLASRITRDGHDRAGALGPAVAHTDSAFAETSELRGAQWRPRYYGRLASLDPGWFGRLTLWPYRINLHREHHERPQLHWHELTEIRDNRYLAGEALWGLLAAPSYRESRHTKG